MDLDSTIAYDTAEQEIEATLTDSPKPGTVAPPSLGGANSGSVAPPSGGGAQSEPLAPSISDGAQRSNHQLAGADDLALAELPTDSLGADAPEENLTNLQETSIWMDKSGDWGLNTLFNESPPVHIYAQKGRAPLKGRGKKGSSSPKTVKESPPRKGYSPVESTSSKGRQRKIPSHLRDYTY